MYETRVTIDRLHLRWVADDHQVKGVLSDIRPLRGMLGGEMIEILTLRANAVSVCIVAIFLLSTSGFAADRPDFAFDGREWVLGHQASEKGVQIEEYVLTGESVENWSELITWQYFPGWQERSNAFGIMSQYRFLRMSRSPGVQWEVLAENDNSVLYKWEIENDPAVGDYFELSRIIEGSRGVHFLHYAAKNRQIFLNNLSAWIGSFQEIVVFE